MRIAREAAWIAGAALAALGLLAACGGEPVEEDLEETAYRDTTAASACAPQIDGGKVAALHVYRDCDGTWRIRATAGGGSASYAGVLTSDKPVQVKAFQLESHDLLDASNPKKVRFRHTMVKSFLDGFDLVLPAGARAVLTLQQGGPLLAGKEAKKVSSPLVLEAGAGSPPATTTPPGTTTPPATTGKRKWFPGHYAKKRATALGNPGYAGYRINLTWRDFEPKLDQFSFGGIKKQLDQAQADGKKALIFFHVHCEGGQTNKAPADLPAGSYYTPTVKHGMTYVLKLYQPSIASKLINGLVHLRDAIDGHPALAGFYFNELIMTPAPAPGLDKAGFFEVIKDLADALGTWQQTPTSITLNWGMAAYKQQIAEHMIRKARIGFRDPDLGHGGDRAKGPGCGWEDGLNCAHVPTYSFLYSPSSKYRGEPWVIMMVSRPTSKCASSPQEALQQANRMGVHFLEWVDYPASWSAAAQTSFIKSLANKPGHGLTSPRPSNWK